MGARPRRRRPLSAPRQRRPARRRGGRARGLKIAAIAFAALVVVFIATRPGPERPAPEGPRGTAPAPAPSAPPRRAPVAAPSVTTAPAKPRREASAPARPTARAPLPRAAREAPGRAVAPRVAIVIDDLGQSLSHLEQLAALGIPISIAVIPGLPASDATVSEASRRGIELLLHQPMEPREEAGKNPGAGVLLASMDAATIREHVRTGLAAVPGAVGVNNHMGSRFTEDAPGLQALMAELKEHGVFWLDSRTSAATRGTETALAVGVPAIQRDVFLDAEVDADFIRRQLHKLVEIARLRGAAVGIGHPHPETIEVLRAERQELLASGVTLVPVSALVRQRPATGTALAAAGAREGRGDQAAAGRGVATP